MAGKPAPTKAKELKASSNAKASLAAPAPAIEPKPTFIVNVAPVTATALQTLTETEKRLPLWLRANGLPRHVADPVEQVFLKYEHRAPLANLWAMIHLARHAERNILTVRRDHGTKPDAMDPAVFVHNVVFMLRSARDDVLKQTGAANIPVVCARLDALIGATKATLGAFMSVPVDRILCDNPTCGIRGAHLLPGPWVDAMERSAEASEEAVRLLTFVGGDNGSMKPPALPAGAEAIDEHDAAILAFLNRSPGLRRKIADVLPDTGPQNRGAIGKRLRKLADRNPPLVDYPKPMRGKRANGVAILPAGIEALKLVQSANATPTARR